MSSASTVKKIFLLLLCGCGYYVLGYGGLHLATINNFASPIWPASGLALGATYLLGYGVAPVFMLASFLLNVTVAPNFIIPAILGLGAMMQAVIGTFILKRFIDRATFNDYSDIFSSILAAIISCAFSATIAIVTLYLFDVVTLKNIEYAWYTWWSGDAVGVMMMIPLFLEIKKNERRYDIKQITEAFILCAVLIAFLYITFTREINQAFLWLTGPALIFIGIRTNRLHASWILIIISILAAFLTSSGHGPFQYGNTNRNLIYIQTLITCFSISVLFIKQMKLGHRVSYRYIVGMGSGALLLFFLTYFTTYYEKKNTLSDYRRVISLALNAIIKASDKHELLLNGTSGAFAMSREVTQEEWKIYVDSIHLPTYFKSLRALAFISNVDKKDAPAFARKNKLTLKSLNKHSSQNLKESLIVTYIEPYAGNENALGLDIGSEPKRYKAAQESRKLHKTVSTEPISLLPDSLDRKAFLVLHPAYNQRKEFIGWTAAAIISETFFDKAFGQLKQSLKIRISTRGEEIYKNFKDDNDEFRKDSFYFRKEVGLFGNVHVIETYPTALFFTRHSDYSVAIPLILNLFLLFVAALIIEQITFGLRSEALVIERTKELDQSKMQLIESSKMASLGEMASGMAHEINNPLTIIQGKIQVIMMILNEHKISDEAIFNELNKIKSTANRIEKIVKGLRNFSRAANQDPFELTPLRDIISETLDLCSEKMKAEGIRFTLHEIPPVSIRCRPTEISQVLINLLNNSRDAIHEREVKWIDVDFRTMNDKIRIIITDSGESIPEEIAQKMMEPFFTTKEVGKGTGLGLSISKGIVNIHNGDLWLDRESRHTRFIIEFKAYS